MQSERKGYLDKLLKNVDRIDLLCFNKTDTCVYSIKNNKGIKIFKEIINGQNDTITDSVVTGHILYYSRGQEVFNVLLKRVSVQYDCKGQVCTFRITYQAGMYADKVCF